MIHSSADLLEFESLRQILSRYLASEFGRAELEKVAPGTDRLLLEEMHSEVGEAIGYLEAARKPQPAARGAAVRIRFDLPDAAVAIRKVSIEGAVLETNEIAALTDVLGRAAEARGLLMAVEGRFPRLAARGAQIGEFRPVLADLSGKILPDGTVADHASVALARLRREMERQRKNIQESLERFLRAHREEGILQEEFVTIRHDRFVVPLIAGQQRKVEGVIHGSSGSGHTLFVEPLETIHLNNELVRLSEEELREVHRILREMTERLRMHASAIAQTAQVFGELELLYAKAQFALDFGAVVPRFSPPSERRLVLEDARHPLLEDVLKRQHRYAVPFSVKMDDNCRTLLVSGPNTGGKTVTLKTLGLLTLMAQAGLPVTCAQAEFPIFDRVLADIGDQQSIQESLSTFSAHIARIRDMVEEVTPDSLVVLDELGRATDPEEGGALGVAVLEHFRKAGAFAIASTHLLALKIYGANTEGVLNGSMGFDENTLEPTYRLRLGAPGKSAGLDIAARLGMPTEIIESARASMSGSGRDVARFLDEIHKRIEAVSQTEKQLQEEREALEARERSTVNEWQQKQAAKLRELERRCDALMREFESHATETIDRILQTVEQRKAAAQAKRQVARTRREFEEEFRATVLSTGDEAQQAQIAPKARIEEGTRVRLAGVSEIARVRRLLPHDMIEVEIGFMKMQAAAGDVTEVLPEADKGVRLPKNVSFQQGPTWNVLQREINVIGMRAEEAIDAIDKFLDSAALAAVQRVRIVHGHGMGVLKRAVSEFLTNSPYVEKFSLAPPSEGGSGATIVELKAS